VYADSDTIRRKGDLVKMWILYNYKTLQSATGVAHLSDSIQFGSQLHGETSTEPCIYVVVRQYGKR